MMSLFTLLSIVLAIESASAFAPVVPATTANHATTGTAINLVPEQGRQLVAFSQDYLSKKAKESASKASNLTNPRGRHTSNKSTTDRSRSKGITAAARSFFFTRLLRDEEHGRKDTSLSASLVEDMELSPVHDHAEDEVLYPIVGFTLVDGHAVPTPEQQAACNLHLRRRGHEEEFGSWSSPQGGCGLWM
jgi:hypothetical protein